MRVSVRFLPSFQNRVKWAVTFCWSMPLLSSKGAVSLKARKIGNWQNSLQHFSAPGMITGSSTNDWLINKILDKAENKGTGNWAAKTSAELGIPSTLIASSLFARYLSFYKEERLKISNLLDNETDYNLNLTSEELLKAYQFARIINHYQGFNLMSEASKAYSWNLNLSEIARIWTNGCIIRSDLMTELVTVLKESENLISFSKITEIIKKIRPSANKVVSQCVLNNIPAPCLSEAVNVMDIANRNSYKVILAVRPN